MTLAVLFFLPQLLLAMIGGRLISLIGRWWVRVPQNHGVSGMLAAKSDHLDSKRIGSDEV
jgi:hypothetical protein